MRRRWLVSCGLHIGTGYEQQSTKLYSESLWPPENYLGGPWRSRLMNRAAKKSRRIYVEGPRVKTAVSIRARYAQLHDLNFPNIDNTSVFEYIILLAITTSKKLNFTI